MPSSYTSTSPQIHAIEDNTKIPPPHLPCNNLDDIDDDDINDVEDDHVAKPKLGGSIEDLVGEDVNAHHVEHITYYALPSFMMQASLARTNEHEILDVGLKIQAFPSASYFQTKMHW